jgi:hypothetical protein
MKWLAIICLLLAGGVHASARTGAVLTTDGSAYHGDIQVDGQRNLVITTAGTGVVLTVPLGRVRHVRFSPILATAVQTQSPMRIPPGWEVAEIGPQRPAPGGAIFQQGVFTLRGAGAELGRRSDSFFYVYQTVNTDVRIEARLVSVGELKRDAVVGLVIREGLQPNAKSLVLGYSPGSGLVIETRPRARDRGREPRVSPPVRLRIERVGNRCHAWWSADGKNWETAQADIDLSLNVPYQVGLAINSGSETEFALARLDNVSVSLPQRAREAVPEGVLLRNGSFIAARVVSADDTTVRFSSTEGNFSASIYRIAQIFLRPMSAETAAQLPGGRTGLVLENGDFFDGEIKAIADGTIRVSSVLFGLRTFSINREVLALSLNPPAPATSGYEIKTQSGSVYRCQTIGSDPGRIHAIDPAYGVIPIALNEITEIALLSRPARP